MVGWGLPVAVVLGLAAALAEGTVEPALQVTVYKVWASSRGDGKDLPEALRRFRDQLRKIHPRGSFRLEEAPVKRVLSGEKALSLRLPQRYEARWTLAAGEGEGPALRQLLVNPKKVRSVDILKKSPAITHLRRIAQGTETFLLIVEFGKPEEDP